MKDTGRDERERGYTSGVPAWEGALGLWSSVRRTRRTRPVDHEPREPQRDPPRERRLSDRRPAAPTLLSEVSRDEECDGDVRAWQAEDLEWPQRQLEAAIIVTRCPVVERAIELRRFVDGGDEAKDQERGRGPAQCRAPNDSRLPCLPPPGDRMHGQPWLQATRQPR